MRLKLETDDGLVVGDIWSVEEYDLDQRRGKILLANKIKDLLHTHFKMNPNKLTSEVKRRYKIPSETKRKHKINP